MNHFFTQTASSNTLKEVPRASIFMKQLNDFLFFIKIDFIIISYIMFIKEYRDAVFKSALQSTSVNPAITRHNVQSFNHFIDHDMEEIIKSKNPVIVESSGLRFEMNFTDVRIKKPNHIQHDKSESVFYPNEARLLNKSYTAPIYVNYRYKVESTSSTGHTTELVSYDSSHDSDGLLEIGKIPILVLSKYCNLHGLSPDQLEAIKEDRYEYGGYFILAGNEYATISQENKIENFVYKNILTENDKKAYSVWIQSKKTGRYDYPYYTTVKLTGSTMTVSVSISKKRGTPLPFTILLSALGILTDRDIIELICPDSDSEIMTVLEQIILNDRKYPRLGQEDSLYWIADRYKGSTTEYHKKYKTQKPEDILRNISFDLFEQQLLPHIGDATNLQSKVLFLGYMLRQTIELSLGRIRETDRDNYANKRVLTCGPMYGQLFRHIFTIQMTAFLANVTNELKKFDEKKGNIVTRTFTSKKMSGMITHITTGEWPAGSTKGFNVKKSQTSRVERKATMDGIMISQKIVAPVADSSSGKNVELHMLYGTHWGFIDASDTPDSQQVGIVKYKTALSRISIFQNPAGIVRWIKTHSDKFGIRETANANPRDLANMVRIFINNDMIYFFPIDRVNEIRNALVEARRKGEIHRMTTIYVDYFQMELYVNTDGGRFIRPLYTVHTSGDKKGKLRITERDLQAVANGAKTFEDLVSAGLIEFLDGHEIIHNTIIALDESRLRDGPKQLIEYTHCEIDPAVIFSLNTLRGLMMDKTQAARVNFQNSMSKQAIGIYVSNYEHRFDVSGNVLVNPQRPLVGTIGDAICGLNEMPAGSMVTIAFMSFEGNNQEDAIITSKGSFDNGLFDVYKYKTYLDMIKNSQETYLKPNKVNTKNFKIDRNYETVMETGLPEPGTVLRKGDVLIGKVEVMTKTERDKYRGTRLSNYEYIDRSVVYSHIEPGTVDKIIVTEDEDNNRVLKIRIRIHSSPNVGDKFASRAAQKGTNGIFKTRDALPFLDDGTVPDIIFNEHGIISRMTCNHMIEPLMSYIAARRGQFLDGSTFTGVDIIDDIIPELKRLGIEHNGMRTIHNPYTGAPMKGKIYSGWIYYQRLKHMVADKMKSRARGGYIQKTRQPGAGRDKDGGLRFGWMEKEAIIAHGAAAMLKEFIYDKSDKFTFYIGEQSGHYATATPKLGRDVTPFYEDPDAESGTQIARVNMPWTTKIFNDYLMMSGVDVRYNLEQPAIEVEYEE